MVYRIESAALQSLIQSLHQHHYTIVGPVRRDGAIVYDTITSSDDFPKGWSDEQRPASYSLRDRKDEELFGFAVGPHSWKQFLFAPVLDILRIVKRQKGFVVSDDASPKDGRKNRLALFGVRACELNAIKVQDKVFMNGTYHDAAYCASRDGLFIIAVNCSTPSETCFCASMGTGPKVNQSCDLTLTEILGSGEHYFVVEVGSDAGEQVMKRVERKPAEQNEIARVETQAQKAAAKIKRTINMDGMKDLLYERFDHPEWEKVGERCLSCANCTLVCPTCFCSTVEDSTSLTGSEAIRTRKWDSCFTTDFSYIHGGSVRTSTKSRYRQWMTHKLAAWVDQFGTPGCVGCGRCITWCPVGIDITDEARVIRESDHENH